MLPLTMMEPSSRSSHHPCASAYDGDDEDDDDGIGMCTCTISIV